MKGFFAFLWRFGIYVLLIFILYVVIIYKVKWEGTTYEVKYLYFYMCGDNLCSTSESVGNFLSKYECEESCPIISEVLDDNKVILQYNNIKFTYDFVSGNIVNE